MRIGIGIAITKLFGLFAVSPPEEGNAGDSLLLFNAGGITLLHLGLI